MANISVQQLADYASVVTGAFLSSPRFVRAILYSVNRISRDLSHISGGDIAVPAIDELSDTLGIDDAYQSVYEAGLQALLQSYGEWGKQANPDAKVEYRMELTKAHGMYSVANFEYGTMGNFTDYSNVNTETLI